MSTIARFIFCLGSFLAMASGQQTWVVGTGGAFGSIAEALQSPLVQPGDTLQLVASQQGPHVGFTLDKGVTIRGPMTINDYQLFGRCDTSIRVPSGQTGRLVDLTFAPGCAGPNGSVSLVRVESGVVVFEGCTFTGTQQASGGTATFDGCTLTGNAPAVSALRVDGGNVILQRCTLNGGGGATGLYVSASSAVVAAACTLTGGPHSCVGRNGCQGPIPSGAGAWVEGRLHGTGLTVRGGDNTGWPFLATAPGVYVSGRVWLSDSQLTGGGHFSAIGGAAVENVSASPARLARSTTTGGAGVPSGPPTLGPVDANAPLLGARTLQPTLQRGAPYQIRFSGAPGSPLILIATAQLERADLPFVEQTLWIGAGNPPWLVLAAGVLSANGDLGFDLQVPNNPHLLDRAAWFHGVGGASVPFQAVAPVGGFVR